MLASPNPFDRPLGRDPPQTGIMLPKIVPLSFSGNPADGAPEAPPGIEPVRVQNRDHEIEQ